MVRGFPQILDMVVLGFWILGIVITSMFILNLLCFSAWKKSSKLQISTYPKIPRPLVPPINTHRECGTYVITDELILMHSYSLKITVDIIIVYYYAISFLTGFARCKMLGTTYHRIPCAALSISWKEQWLQIFLYMFWKFIQFGIYLWYYFQFGCFQ